MRVNKQVVSEAVFFFFLSILAFVESFKIRSYLGTYDLLMPLRSDNYLKFISIVIAVCISFYLVYEVFYLKVKSGGLNIKLKGIALPIIVLIAYIFVVEPLGFILSTFLFFYVFLHWLSKYSFRNSLLISAAIAICCHLAFVTAFQLTLPVGIIENLIKF